MDPNADPVARADGTDGALTAELAHARTLVAGARRIVVLTGAGISTDSGIPDFRGPNGVWTRNPKAEKMAHIDAYLGDPAVRERAWRNRLESEVWQARPNAGHRALVELEARGSLLALLTQNIDGLHLAAGSDPDLVVQVHGTAHEVLCMSCDERAPMQRALDRVAAGEVDPPCRTCGGILKAAVISFGQNLVVADLERAFAAAASCDLLVAIGTSLGVYPIAEVVPTALRAGASLVFVNAEPTPFDRDADVVLRGSISEVLPQIVG
jgi:NAD-dependent deacetylase